MVESRFMLHEELAKLLREHHPLKSASIARVQTFILALRTRKKGPHYFSKAYAAAFMDYLQGERPHDGRASEFSRSDRGRSIIGQEKQKFLIELNRLALSKTGLTNETFAQFMGIDNNTVLTLQRQGAIVYTTLNERRVINIDHLNEHFFWTL